MPSLDCFIIGQNYKSSKLLLNMLTLTEHFPAALNNFTAIAQHTLPLTAEERQRSRHRFMTAENLEVRLDLPRGTVLRDGDLLKAKSDLGTTNPTDIFVKVVAKPEPVITVTAHTSLHLLKAAYHLGNRHVPLEITDNYLRLSPDSVLADMLKHMNLHIHEELVPFQPEAGAYAAGHHHHSHEH